ncbi:PLAC8 family-domain-containing protein [Globomyces pollinis-pini]|nr:PLAC8 family-domain-containing protein [Globomyces pollinis-pini]
MDQNQTYQPQQQYQQPQQQYAAPQQQFQPPQQQYAAPQQQYQQPQQQYAAPQQPMQNQPYPPQQPYEQAAYPPPQVPGQVPYQQQLGMDVEYAHVPKSQTGEFAEGFCGCTSNCLTCCLAFCCPCVVFGQNQFAIKPESSCFSQGAIYCIVSMLGCAPCLGAYGRQNVRDARNTDGDFIGDCVAHWCCPCLALTQENSELKAAGVL